MTTKRPRAGKVCYAFDAFVKAERELTSTVARNLDLAYVAEEEQEVRDTRRHLGQQIQEALDAIDDRAVMEFYDRNASALESPYVNVRMGVRQALWELEAKTTKARDRARDDLRVLVNKLRR